MKGFRFYAEMPEERKSKSASKAYPFFPWTVKALRERAAEGFRCDCVALILGDNGRPVYSGNWIADAIGVAISGNRLSYCLAGVADDYLQKRCVRIPEDLARILSPELFRYLES